MNRRAGLAGVKAIALLWLALAGSGCVPARGYFSITSLFLRIACS